MLASSYIRIQLGETVTCDTSILIVKVCVGSKCKRERIELEAGVVGSDSIYSDNALVQSIHPRPTTPSAGDFYSNIR